MALRSRSLVLTLGGVALVAATACATVAAPRPATEPAQVRHQEHEVTDGLPDLAITLASDTSGAEAPAPAVWLPEASATSMARSSMFGISIAPLLVDCQLEIEPTIGPLVVAEALPAVPSTNLDPNVSEPDCD